MCVPPITIAQRNAIFDQMKTESFCHIIALCAMGYVSGSISRIVDGLESGPITLSHYRDAFIRLMFFSFRAIYGMQVEPNLHPSGANPMQFTISDMTNIINYYIENGYSEAVVIGAVTNDDIIHIICSMVSENNGNL